MTEQSDVDTQELEPLDVPDESVEADTEDAHPAPSAKEETLGQLLGEGIDTADDEDTGIGEPDELDPEEKVSPYTDGEVVQDADEPT